MVIHFIFFPIALQCKSSFFSFSFFSFRLWNSVRFPLCVRFVKPQSYVSLWNQCLCFCEIYATTHCSHSSQGFTIITLSQPSSDITYRYFPIKLPILIILVRFPSGSGLFDWLCQVKIHFFYFLFLFSGSLSFSLLF